MKTRDKGSKKTESLEIPPADVRIETGPDGTQFLMMGSLKLHIGEEGRVDLTDHEIPNTPLKDIPEDIVFEYHDDRLHIGVLDFYDADYNVTFGDSFEVNYWDHALSLQTCMKLLELSIKSHPDFGKKLKLDTMQDMSLVGEIYFSAKVEGENLNQLVSNARRLLTEIFEPIVEIENFLNAQEEKLQHNAKSRQPK